MSYGTSIPPEEAKPTIHDERQFDLEDAVRQRRPKAPKLPKHLRALNELLEDSKTCIRLSERDEEFLTSMRANFARFGASIRVTEKQQAWLKDIEKKVYAT
jgi:hypothetical protein